MVLRGNVGRSGRLGVIMTTILLAVLLSASGDPYAEWTTDKAQLTTAQRTTFVNQVLSRSPGMQVSQFTSLDCGRKNGHACCTPIINDPQAGEAIRALLLSGVTWSPGLESGTQTKTLAEFCITGTALGQFVNYIKNITPGADGPLIQAYFDRIPGTNDVFLITRYKRSMTAADCATYADTTLVPAGITP